MSLGLIRMNISFKKAISLHTLLSTVYKRCEKSTKSIHTSSTQLLFFEGDPKSGYEHLKQKPKGRDIVRNSLKQIKHEIELWKTEIQDTWDGDFMLKGMPGVVDKEFQFQSDNDLQKWIVTSDKDNLEGESNCELSITPGGKGLFTGNLSLEVPKDGVVRKTGYCNMRSVRVKKSFQRDTHYDWGMYTHIVMRVRGDGRSYALNLGTSSYFDQTWNDVYTYVLFTRGGPYWQYSRIPFSKFFFTSKGRIQDLQFPVPLTHISSFGITIAERVGGPFRLEIDYIGLEFDENHTERFAYELYQLEPGLAAT